MNAMTRRQKYLANWRDVLLLEEHLPGHLEAMLERIERCEAQRSIRSTQRWVQAESILRGKHGRLRRYQQTDQQSWRAIIPAKRFRGLGKKHKRVVNAMKWWRELMAICTDTRLANAALTWIGAEYDTNHANWCRAWPVSISALVKHLRKLR